MSQGTTERRTSLRWHTLALVVAVLAVWPLLDLDGAFISDEGSYAVQERALAAGGWDMGYPFEAADPDRRFVPFHGAVVTADEVHPYVSHPAWPWLLRRSTSVFGFTLGVRALGVGSLVALAAIAWHLGVELGGPQAGPWAFWLAAASPALANAWIMWAHVPSAAMAALLALAMLRSRRSARWLAVGAAAAAASVLLRSEGVLWVGAVATALIVVGRDRRSVLHGAVVGSAGAAAYLAQHAWRAAILGDGAGRGDDLHVRAAGTGLADRLRGFRLVVLDGSFASQSAKALSLGVVIAAAGAAVAVIRRRDPRPASVLLAVAAGLLLVRVLVASADPAPGLLVAAPSVLLALAWRARDRSQRWLPVAIAVFAGAVAASIYPEGGSLQWGGRFLSPVVGPLAALSGAAIAGWLRSTAPASGVQRGFASAVVALAVAQATGAIVVPDRLRTLSEAPIERIAALGPDVVAAGGTQVARLDWQGWPERCWIAVPDEETQSDVRAMVQVLSDSGVREAVYAGIDPAALRAAGAIVDGAEGRYEIGTFRLPGVTEPLAIASPYRCHG